MNALTQSFKQKLRTRIPSAKEYVHAVRADSRQAAYKLLPIVTRPAMRRAVTRAWSAFKPCGDFGPLDAQGLQQLDQLRKEGVVLDMPSVAPRDLAEIVGYFKAQPCHDPYRLHLGNFPWDTIPSPETNMGFYTSEQIVRAPHVMRLFNHPRLLQLAQAYIGCKPTLDNIGCWWSYSDRKVAKGTQKFHRDFDSFGGFKVFFYLCDVGLQQGPHEYVRSSHQRQSIDTGAGIDDDLVWQVYGKALREVITGEAGSSFIADTFGIHRGQLPTEGMRLLLCAQYNVNVSPHGPRHPVCDSSALGLGGLDRYVNRIYLGD